MDNFKLSGADIEIRYHGNKLFVQGKDLPVSSDGITFSDDSIAKSESDMGELMTVVLLDSSRSGRRHLLHLIVPKTSPSTQDLGSTGQRSWSGTTATKLVEPHMSCRITTSDR